MRLLLHLPARLSNYDRHCAGAPLCFVLIRVGVLGVSNVFVFDGFRGCTFVMCVCIARRFFSDFLKNKYIGMTLNSDSEYVIHVKIQPNRYLKYHFFSPKNAA